MARILARTNLSLSALLTAILAAGCVVATEEPLMHGTLCMPAEEGCASTRTLVRQASGRSQIDLRIVNQSTDQATMSVLALTPDSTDFITDAGSSDTGAEAIAERVIASRTYLMSAEEEINDRFTVQDLGLRETVELFFSCTSTPTPRLECSGELDYVLTTVPVECLSDDDCSGSWKCDTAHEVIDTPIGRCVECVENSDCATSQQCDIVAGRCTPEIVSESGCNQTTRPAPTHFPLLVLVLWVMNTLFRRKSPRDKHLAMTTVVLATFLCSPHADAKPPEVAVSVGAGPRFLTEPFGKDVKRGLGIDVGQEWRWTYVGIGAEIGAAYYLTTQEAPPISRGIQTYLFALGPRGFLPLGPLVFAVGIDYARFGILGNSLLRQTSPPDTAANPLAYHLVGFRSGVRYRWSGLELRLAGSYLPLFEVESAVVGVSLTLGITGGRP